MFGSYTIFNQPNAEKMDFSSSTAMWCSDTDVSTLVLSSGCDGRAYLSYVMSRSRFRMSVQVSFHSGLFGAIYITCINRGIH